MSYDKESVKEQLELEDVYDLLEYFEAEPQMFSNYIIAKTICHNGDTHKLYYYENTQLFKCYTGGCGIFDIFELVQKIQDEQDLNKAIYFVVNFFNLQSKLEEADEDFSIIDYKYLSQVHKLAELTPKIISKVNLPMITNYIKFYPQPQIISWKKEGISKNVCDYMGIKYNPVNGAILIPHVDQDGRLIGIRQRTLVQEDEIYGKYRPARLQNQLCNHPLAFNLYGLYQAKENIINRHIALVVESEKAVLQYITYFGLNNDICVAVCGSSMSNYQFHLLLDCGVKEIIFGFDKDYHYEGTEEFNKVEDKLNKIYMKYSGHGATLSFLIDKKNLLGYKDSPLDQGKEVFLQLFTDRIIV